MSSTPTKPLITLSSAEILFQVGSNMKSYPEISVTMPASTTWNTAISSTASALAEQDRGMHLFTPRTSSTKDKLRRLALEENSSRESKMNIQNSIGRPIRPVADLKTIPVPQKASEHIRNKLREEAKSWKLFSDPYPIHLRALVAEQTLATVSGSLRLCGIDSVLGDPEFTITSEPFLFDTGAHSCIIVEDLLPSDFRAYLRSPQNDPYRSEDRTRVQVDGTFVFSNHTLEISTVFLIVPRRDIPNGLIGILIGQKGFLNRITYRSIPRDILVARGDPVGGDVWGDIIVEDYLTLDGELLKL